MLSNSPHFRDILKILFQLSYPSKLFSNISFILLNPHNKEKLNELNHII